MGIKNYFYAKSKYDGIKPWRGDFTNVKPVSNSGNLRKRHHRNIRLGNDGSVIFRFWATDIASYHPDGSITVSTYGSKTTSEFMDAYGPESLGFSFMAEPKFFWLSDGYRHQSGKCVAYSPKGSTFRLLRDENDNLYPHPEDVEEVSYVVVDRKRSNLACKLLRFKEYTAFWQATAEMAPGQIGKTEYHNQLGYRNGVDEIIEALKDATRWIELVRCGYDPDYIRSQVQTYYMCFKEVVPEVVTVNDIKRIIAHQDNFSSVYHDGLKYPDPLSALVKERAS